jgi:hypothetical protein
MARVTVALVMVLTTATTAYADPSTDDVGQAAFEADVDVLDLQGAVNSTGLPPRKYLCVVDGLLCPPAPVLPPVSPYAGQRKCIEGKESGFANVPNARGSGAVGVMQYMPSTFAAHAREMGHSDWSPWVPWQAEAVAEWDLAHRRRAQWTVGGC